MKYVLILDYLYDGNDVFGVQDESGVYWFGKPVPESKQGDWLSLDDIFENGSFVAFSSSKARLSKVSHALRKQPF